MDKSKINAKFKHNLNKNAEYFKALKLKKSKKAAKSLLLNHIKLILLWGMTTHDTTNGTHDIRR